MLLGEYHKFCILSLFILPVALHSYRNMRMPWNNASIFFDLPSHIKAIKGIRFIVLFKDELQVLLNK